MLRLGSGFDELAACENRTPSIDAGESANQVAAIQRARRKGTPLDYEKIRISQFTGAANRMQLEGALLKRPGRDRSPVAAGRGGERCGKS